MRRNKFASVIAVGAILSWGASGSIVSAADMMALKVKAPPPSVPLDIHYFADVTFLNDYITPRGLLVTNTGLATQILTGIALDLYKDKTGFINDISVNGGPGATFGARSTMCMSTRGTSSIGGSA
jgi:hypothetical protein